MKSLLLITAALACTQVAFAQSPQESSRNLAEAVNTVGINIDRPAQSGHEPEWDHVDAVRSLTSKLGDPRVYQGSGVRYQLAPDAENKAVTRNAGEPVPDTMQFGFAYAVASLGGHIRTVKTVSADTHETTSRCVEIWWPRAAQIELPPVSVPALTVSLTESSEDKAVHEAARRLPNVLMLYVDGSLGYCRIEGRIWFGDEVEGQAVEPTHERLNRQEIISAFRRIFPGIVDDLTPRDRLPAAK